MSYLPGRSKFSTQSVVLEVIIAIALCSLGLCGCAPSAKTVRVNAACEENDVAVLQDLVTSGAFRERIQIGDMDIEDEWMYPVQAAARYGNPTALRMFLTAGADPNQRSSEEMTPLMYLYEGSCSDRAVCLECTQLLLKAGADVTCRDEHEKSVLHFAARSDCPQVVELLIASGAEVNAVNWIGNTPLHDACDGLFSSSRDVVEVLLKAGADRNAKNEAGKRPIDVCRENSRCDADDLLADPAPTP